MTVMRVVSAEVRRSDAPRSSARLTLRDDAGREGQGDAAPLAPFSREDIEGCARALDRARDVGAIDLDLPAIDAISRALAGVAAALDAAPSARFAIEAALCDLIAQRRATSVAAILGGGAYDRVATNALLVAPPVETLADRAEALARSGFSAIKIKLRAASEEGFERELGALREVRERLPFPYDLRLDPNGAWSLDEAARRLDALAPIAPRYVEQPVAARDLHRLGERAVPWAADESLAIPALVPALLSSRGCAAFVLKPAALGGIFAARDLALRAQDHGLDVVVTHFFDGPFAVAAACELALSLPRPPIACGLAPHEELARFGAFAIPQLDEPCFARSSGGPGLGVRSIAGREGDG